MDDNEMQPNLSATVQVLPGNRVEFRSPELIVGETVEIVVLRSESETGSDSSVARRQMGIADWLQSLKREPRPPEYWEEVERSFREERNSWGD